MDDTTIDKKIKSIILKMRLLFWINSFSIDQDLNLIPGDNEDLATILIRRSDFRKWSFIDVRNALYCFVHDIPPEIAKPILSSGENGNRAIAQRVARLFRESNESLEDAVERILS